MTHVRLGSWPKLGRPDRKVARRLDATCDNADHACWPGNGGSIRSANALTSKTRRSAPAKESPHPESGVEIGRDGATVWSLDRRRRTMNANYDCDSGNLRARPAPCLVRIAAIR